MKTTLNISGMHCASCAVNIERALKKTKGVASANVNLATEKATIEHDDAATVKTLISSVKDRRHGASMDHHHADAHEHNSGVKRMFYFSLLYPWTDWLLSPLIAGSAMALSSASVVGNSLLLKNKKI